MKKIFIYTIVALLVTVVALDAQQKRQNKILFTKGSHYVTPKIAFGVGTFMFGGSYGIGLTENIEAGVVALFGLGDGYTVIVPGVEAVYHFTQLDLPVDLFAGASLMYYIISINDYFGVLDSDFVANLVLGARYFFKPNMAITFTGYYGMFGLWAGGYGTIGLTIGIK